MERSRNTKFLYLRYTKKVTKVSHFSEPHNHRQLNLYIHKFTNFDLHVVNLFLLYNFFNPQLKQHITPIDGFL